MKFGSLWIGPTIPKLQQICLSSFIYHGHEVTLYVYDQSLVVPDGVIKKDANEIFGEDNIFLVMDSYAPFSDLFRYIMINKTGLVWTDADNICLSDDWDFKDGIVAGVEYSDSKYSVMGSILGLPQDSKIIKYIIKTSQNFDKSKIRWSELGSKIIDDAFIKFNYLNYVQKQEIFYPIVYQDWEILWNSDKKHIVENIIKESKSISTFNAMAKRSNTNTDFIPKGSFLELCHDKFIKRSINNE
jgi:hypothetical protein